MTPLKCSCGHCFEPTDTNFIGVQNYDVERHSLHNCDKCGSTRAVVVWVALTERPKQ